eukprot:4221372-Pleurochrysis_carterae.AAC.2
MAELQEALITMAARDIYEEAATDRLNPEAHREARRRKGHLARDAGIKKLQWGYFDALYYFEKWGSPVC